MNVSPEPTRLPPSTLLESVDRYRLEANRTLDRAHRSELGQFMTPPRLASFMASLFGQFPDVVRVLDAGAGVGSLLAAFACEAARRKRRPNVVHATAFDVDRLLISYLRRAVDECRRACSSAGVDFTADVLEADFIEAAAAQLDAGLFKPSRVLSFTHAILNPPYKKLNSASSARLALRRAGVETSNLYTAFLALAILLLEPGGELVAITPRSFCNGPYFRPFREIFFREMALRRVHVFESRKAAFADDEVLQENVIIHAVKGVRTDHVVVSSSSGPEEQPSSSRIVPFSEVVRPGDRDMFIHVVPDDTGERVAATFARLPARLQDLDVAVSTGKVVDFRAREYLSQEPNERTGPLIYPTHLAAGTIRWPKPGKKPNGLLDVAATADLWMPSGTYVLVKRFSAKEERRRVVAAVFEPSMAPGAKVGFENHLNVFHRAGRGLPPLLARGLATFLNSTLVDQYFRQFNGHTQVNASDLRSLRFPTTLVLEQLGSQVADPGLAQEDLDAIVEAALRLESSEEP